MKLTHALLISASFALCFSLDCVPDATAQQPSAPILINGMAPVTVSRKPTPGATSPEFTSITVMPGRGMEVQQITAWYPGKGEIDVLASPSLAQSAAMLNDHDTANGDLGYRLGAAFLFPYPNRIRGKLSPDGKMLTTEWQGHPITLPANSAGGRPGAERHAMHGLILKGKISDLKVSQNQAGGVITGVLHCGDFDGHWFSSSDLVYSISLTAQRLDVSITAHNVGSQPEPVAIAWHPYFNLPSGDRKQVRLHIPASALAEVNNYDDVFPTGKIMPVAGTAYDFQAPSGRPLGNQFLDDNFSSLERKSGPVVVTVTDPVAHYGVRIEGLSPEIRTIQVYAPPAKNFVAVEDQFNFGDPFGKEWGTRNTGMVTLAPGNSTRWHVRLELIQP